MRNFIQNFHDGLLIPPPGEEKAPKATTDTELSSTENIQPLPVQEPPQDFNMHQLIDECCEEVPEEQKQNMEKTMPDLVKICHHKQFLCIHDDVDDLIESALDSKLLSINSIISQLTTILSIKEPEDSLSIGYEHLSITPETESNKVTESNAKNLLPISSECEVTSEDKRECDELVCDNYSDTFSDSKIDDDISVYDDDFEDIEYVEVSLPDPEIVSVKEENSVEEDVVQQEEEEVNFEYISQVQDVVLREKLFSITQTRSGNTTHANYSLPEYDSFCFEIEPDQERLINLVENDNSDSSNDPLLEGADLFLDDNPIPPGIENFADDLEGYICFLEKLLIDDSILSHESFDSNFEDNPSIP
nr:hypothetical protein [Tanacetum cinerariifolium]